MMHVTLKLLGPFRSLGGNADASGAYNLALAPGTRLCRALSCAPLPDDVPKVILLNGVKRDDDPPLSDGDTITVFPPIAGVTGPSKSLDDYFHEIAGDAERAATEAREWQRRREE